MNTFKEDNLEKVFISYIEDLGYQYVYQEDIDRSSRKSAIDDKTFKDSLVRLNPEASIDVLEQAYKAIAHIDAGLLEVRNASFFEYLQNGIEISHFEEGEQKTTRVYLIDYKDVDKNTFTVTNQLTIVGKETKRPDIIVYVNGLPLVVIELKSAMTEDADISNAYRQIRNYQQDIPELFVYNAFNIISDFTETKVGTITSNESWYKAWKSVDGTKPSISQAADYKTPLGGVLTPSRLLDIIKNFTFFENKDGDTTKIMAQYHQYFAVRKAVQSTLEAMERGDGRGGVFWHTQGSGKSLSMVFYTQLMTQILDQPTFVVLTDRNDLDDQLYGQFSRAKDFLRQDPKQATSRDHLKDLLNNRKSNGIFFSTMQKFAESEDPLTDRSDVIVMTDEAHRSQYGLKERITPDGKLQHGMARLVRKSLPQATYIGFTGTPLSENDRDTQEVFGEYIDVYDMTQSVEDGATKPIFYENRVVNLGFKEDILKELDDKYAELALQANEDVIEKSKRDLSKMEQLLGSEEAINSLVDDIVTHYEENREGLLTGKAMIVAYNRSIAMKIYRRILDIRPHWTEKVEVVMTSNNNDPEEWKQVIGTKAHKDELARKFKDNKDPMKIAIVVDMWLTGFDVPSLATMYIYKPMKGHNLMQAIARVNRVFEDKEGGLIVDYVGLAKALEEAMSDYTRANQQRISNANIRYSAYPQFQEKLEVIRNVYFYRFDYEIIFLPNVSDEERADTIRGGLNHYLTFPDEKRKKFRDEAYALKQAHSLCSSLSTKREQREAAYFEAIRISSNRLIHKSGKLSLKEVNEQISELLAQAFESKGIINLFQDAESSFSLFDPDFLDKIARLNQKNLSVELLSKILNDEIKSFSHYDIVKGQEFSERLRKIMKRYKDALKKNAETLDMFENLIAEEDNSYSINKSNDVELDKIREDLLKLARQTKEVEEENRELGLTKSEIAFYHALNNPDDINNHYTKDELIEITKDLTETISDEMTSDWYKRESGLANVRSKVRRLLKKYKYPPEYLEPTINLVVKQAEHWDEMDQAVGAI